MGERFDEQAQVREALADHFVMWRERTAPKPGPRGEWACACGLVFGFSDSAIDHQAEVIERTVADRLAAQRSDVLNEVMHRILDSRDEDEDGTERTEGMTQAAGLVALYEVYARNGVDLDADPRTRPGTTGGDDA